MYISVLTVIAIYPNSPFYFKHDSVNKFILVSTFKGAENAVSLKLFILKVLIYRNFCSVTVQTFLEKSH